MTHWVQRPSATSLTKVSSAQHFSIQSYIWLYISLEDLNEDGNSVDIAIYCGNLLWVTELLL